MRFPAVTTSLTTTIPDSNLVAVDKDELESLRHKYKFTYCAYCGEEFEIDADGTPADVSEHIATCPEHPMHDVIAQRDRLKAELAELERKADSVDEWREVAHALQADNERYKAALEAFPNRVMLWKSVLDWERDHLKPALETAATDEPKV